MAVIMDDVAIAGQLNEVYEELRPNLVRDPSVPFDESVLRAGRGEISASDAIAVAQHWTENECRFVDCPNYVAWQLSYAHIATMGEADRDRLARAIIDTLTRVGHDRQVPVRLWRYVVASERVAD